MSYCRFSSDDFRSDVYCYADVRGGWTIHVAGNRLVFPEPLPEPVDYRTDPDAWFERFHEVMALVDRAERVNIGGPHDGEYFNEPTALAAAERLESLRDAGYHVPEDAIRDLREEAEGEERTEP